MKKFIILTIAVFTGVISFAQTHSCCSAPEQFASLGNDMAFVNAHDAPIPFHFVSNKGNMMTYHCSDGKDANAFAIMAKEKTDNYVFVVHEWWGLNDYIKQISEQIYNDLGEKVNVIALDLYDGKVAATPDSAKSIMKGLDQQRANTIITSLIEHVGPAAKVATIGWCMGGGYSLQATIALKQNGVGCIMYYGMPEADISKLQQINGEVLMMWANQDKWIKKETVDQFKTNMETAGKKLKVEEYAADHAFANPSNPKYNKELADDAYQKSIRFLKQIFSL